MWIWIFGVAQSTGISVKDWLGPAATVAAAIAVVGTAWWYNSKQVKLAKDKLRLDLFDRRLAVLTAVITASHELYKAQANSYFTVPDETSKNLLNAVYASQYLFPEGSPIYQTVDQIHALYQMVGQRPRGGFGQHASELQEIGEKVKLLQEQLRAHLSIKDY